MLELNNLYIQQHQSLYCKSNCVETLKNEQKHESTLQLHTYQNSFIHNIEKYEHESLT
jgi:hypothetical protein